MPLTNPEHFGNPVTLGRRRRRRRDSDDSDDDDADSSYASISIERDVDWGKVVCVDYGDKRGSKKDIWFPALIVAPTCQENQKINPKDEYLVKSFKDGRFYQVAKKDARALTKEMVDNLTTGASTTLRSALEKATNLLERKDIPPGWDWDLLIGNKIPQVRND